jgi:ketosteroid isomerase-like protein
MPGEAAKPEDVTRLIVERLNAGDASGVAALYEPDAVLAYPADQSATDERPSRPSTSGWWTRGSSSPKRRRCLPSDSRTSP